MCGAPSIQEWLLFGYAQAVMLIQVWMTEPATMPLFLAQPRIPTLLVDVLTGKRLLGLYHVLGVVLRCVASTSGYANGLRIVSH